MITKRNLPSAMHLGLVIFLFFGSYSSFVFADYNKYVPLISDIHAKFSTSSVFLVHSPNNSEMQNHATANSLTRIFSMRGVFTVNTRFEDLDDDLKYHRKRTGRPLVVILLKSLDEISEFNSSDKKMSQSYPIWLAIFDSDSNDHVCEYCRNPVGNKFRLRLDTLMLVHCCDATVLHEWWSVDGNRTEIGNIASWSPNERLKLLSTEGLIARRSDVRGTGLRVIVTEPSVFPGGASNPGVRYYEKLLSELRGAMNFTLSELILATGSSTTNLTTISWSGMIGSLTREEADLAIVGLVMIPSRLDVIDFTHPVIILPMKLFIKQPDRVRRHWFAYFEVYTLNSWLITITLIITAPFLLAVIEVQNGSKTLKSVYLDNVLAVWGIFCQQGLDAFPDKTSMRIAFMAIYISAVLLYVAYAAKLISYLAVSNFNLPFSDMAGFLRDGSYKLIVPWNSQRYTLMNSSTDSIAKQIMKRMKPWKNLPQTEENAWEQVCKERVAYYTFELAGEYLNAKCKVVGIATGDVLNMALGLPAGSQYTGVVNYHIQRFRENGVFRRMEKILSVSKKSTATGHKSVAFSGAAPILSILAGGLVLALIMLFCEIIYRRIDNRRQSNSRRIRNANNRRVIDENSVAQCCQIRGRNKIVEKAPTAHLSVQQRLRRRTHVVGKPRVFIGASCKPVGNVANFCGHAPLAVHKICTRHEVPIHRFTANKLDV